MTVESLEDDGFSPAKDQPVESIPAYPEPVFSVLFQASCPNFGDQNRFFQLWGVEIGGEIWAAFDEAIVNGKPGFRAQKIDRAFLTEIDVEHRDDLTSCIYEKRIEERLAKIFEGSVAWFGVRKDGKLFPAMRVI